MAAPTRILTLNVGSQTLGVADFRAQANGGLVLNGYAFREIIAEAAGDATRNAQITGAISEMFAELHIKRSPLNYSISGQSVFTRFVKLPAVDEEKIERIITFEAQQNVPFPIEEVVWDYQLVGGGAEERIEVVLVAVKADLLEGINAAVEAAGARTRLVDVATMALYNAFRYNYSELTGCSLLIDIGARTTNVLFSEPAHVFSRSIPIGGGSITSAIAREFGEPFPAAELRKKADGFVSLGGAYAEPSDADVARVSKIVRNTMTRLHAEITRSISHYRAQQQGAKPERVFLCGGSSSMPYMREFFREKLQLPIDFFNPLRNVTVAQSVDSAQLGRSAHLLGELVGLSLRSATTCPMELNLRPASVVRAQRIEQRQPFLIIAAACFLLGLLGWAAYFARGAHLQTDATDQLQQKVTAMKSVETRMTQLRKDTTALDVVAAPLIALVNDRNFWPEILEDLNARMPKEDIWITELVATSTGKPIGTADATGNAAAAQSPPTAPVPSTSTTARPAPAKGPMIDGIFVRGLYLFNPRQQEVVVDYFRNLVGSPYFVVDPNNQSRVIKPSTPTNTEWAFPYELRLDLRKPITLP
jgi:type IV pilus assembly protein PilM